MREYETTFIVQPEISDEGVQTVCDRLDAVLSRRNATRLMVDDLGRRRLAYEIQNFQKGRYLTLMYLDTGDAVPEIERTLRLEDSVLRFLTIQVNDLVVDVEARKAEAAELERIRAEKAAERAARDAEEAARAEAEEAARAEAEESEPEAEFSEDESDEEGDDDEDAETAEDDDEEEDR
jgi:small subunit ribosomal protein S6